MHPGARDHYVGFRVAAGGGAARPGSTGSRSRRRVAIGRDAVRSAARRGGRAAAHVVDVAAFELSLHAGDGRAVRARSSPRRREPPPDWPAAPPAARDDHPVTFVDWHDARRVLRLGRRPAADRGRVGEGGARRRRAQLSRGATRTDPAARAVGGGPKRGDDVAGRRASRRREPVRSARHGRATSGSGSRAPTGRTRTTRPTAARSPPARRERVLRGGSFASPGLALARCAMRSRSRPAAPPGPHRIPRRARRSTMTRRRRPAARPDARARRGREPDRRHRRRGAAVRAAGCEEIGHGGRAARRRLPGDADRGRAAAAAASPGRRSCSTATSTRSRSRTTRRAIEDGRVYGRGSADMKGAARLRARGGAGVRASGPFAGELVLVAIGLHEAPGGRGEDLTHLLAETGFTRRLRRRLRAVAATTSRRAHGPGDRRDRRSRGPGMPTHELQTPAGTPHPLRRGGARGRGDARARRGAGRDRAPVGRRRDVLRRRGARRRLLQPLPGELPDRRHAPLGARQHARGGRGRVPRAARRRRRRDGLRRSTSTCASSAARTRSTSSIRSSLALARGVRGGDGRARSSRSA